MNVAAKIYPEKTKPNQSIKGNDVDSLRSLTPLDRRNRVALMFTLRLSRLSELLTKRRKFGKANFIDLHKAAEID